LRDALRPKVVILGLDGVDWPLIQRLTAEGITPRLGALARDSQSGPMLSTLPEISPVAWTTFFTGRPPGCHGIYGFTDFAEGGYDLRFNSSSQVRTPFLWDWVGLGGRRSVVLNVPLTYPAQALSGLMVSGFVSVDYDRAAYPGWVAGYLKETGYRLEADFDLVHEDREAFLEELDGALAGREKLLEKFWPEEWDLFVLVVTDTDRLQHFFRREFEETGPITDYFLNFFSRVDALVGRVHDLSAALADQTDEGVLLILLSDHGFTGVKEEFHLNRWLAAHGYLNQVGPEALALALDPTRLYINRPPRFVQGRVKPAETREITDRLKMELSAEPAVAETMDGEEIFAGPAQDSAPDLVVRPTPGYEFKAKFSSGPIYTPSLLQGTHTRENAFFMIQDFGSERNSIRIQEIHDLGRFVFSRLGL